ncbi:MAG TPA: M48 family metallopeptidase [Steroidobacteraceae bacterium]|nr:M48 family metallopeptidase [Steroidobacteraceae bacterium]
MRQRRRAISGLMGMALLAWVAPGHAITEQEQRARLLFVTREAEAHLESQGLLYGDAALDAYLQSVMDNLYPERHGEYRVRALRDTEFNAFAVATGNLYIFTGALLRLRNEAELAAVLGHEGGHLVGDHMYRGIVESKSVARIGAALTLGLATTLPGLGALVNYSTMAGFSRDFEREADHTGFQRLTAAGYEPKAAAPVFDRMAREVTERKIKQPPYIFADHPKLLERAHDFANLAADSPAGDLRVSDFVAATQAARVASLEQIHERRDGAELIAVLGDDGRAAEFAPSGEFLLGEGYRFRAADGDESRALEHYTRSIEQYPDFAPAYGTRGRLRARRGEHDAAIADLERFVALAPAARETPFAHQTIDRLRKESPK